MYACIRYLHQKSTRCIVHTNTIKDFDKKNISYLKYVWWEPEKHKTGIVAAFYKAHILKVDGVADHTYNSILHFNTFMPLCLLSVGNIIRVFWYQPQGPSVPNSVYGLVYLHLLLVLRTLPRYLKTQQTHAPHNVINTSLCYLRTCSSASQMN